MLNDLFANVVTHGILFGMAIGIGILMYVPLSLIIALIVSFFKKKPAKEYFKKAILLGLIVGGSQGILLAEKDLEKFKASQPQVQKRDKASIQRRMSEIINLVLKDPEQAKEYHKEFYTLANEFVIGSQKELNILKFNLSSSFKIYKEWVFKDAIDSIKLGRSVKSSRRYEIEKGMLEGNPEFQKQIDLDDSFIELVANKKSITSEGDPIVYGIKDIERVAKQSQYQWLSVEGLFDSPEY